MDGRHRKRDRLGIVHFKPLFPTSGGPRGAIQGFSVDSRRRLAWTLANAPVDFAVHITLTYHARVDETDGDQVAVRNRSLVERAKADLNRLLACLRAEIGAYCWIQEFQKRGAIHFHILCEHAIAPERVALAWCRATGQLDDPHALKHAVRVRRVEDQTTVRRYLVKYFGKAAQKSRPPGVDRAGRYWGASRDLRAEPLAEVVTCHPKARKHDRSALQVRRAFQRYVSKCVGFKWRGGRLTCWQGDVPERAHKVLDQLRRFYREPGYVMELVDRFDWEFVAELSAFRHKLMRPDTGVAVGDDWTGLQGVRG
jgi:hypothetical protein